MKTLSPEVVNAILRLRVVLATQAVDAEAIEREGGSDEVYRRLRPMLTSRWIEKARNNLDDVLLAELGLVSGDPRRKLRERGT